MVYVGVAICSYMCMQVHDNANKISTIPRQCHPAAITQMVMDGLHCPLGNVMQSEHGQRPRLLVLHNYTVHSSTCTVVLVVTLQLCNRVFVQSKKVSIWKCTLVGNNIHICIVCTETLHSMASWNTNWLMLTATRVVISGCSNKGSVVHAMYFVVHEK